MKDEEEENNLDQRFKEGLSKAEDNIAFRNADWDAMEKLLDEEKRRKGFIYRLPAIITAIAAMLLLALGFFFLRPETKPRTDKNDMAGVKPSKNNANSFNQTNTDSVKNGGSDLANNKTQPIDKTSTYTKPFTGNTANNNSDGDLKDHQLTTTSNGINQLAGVVNGTKPNKTSTGKVNGLNSDILPIQQSAGGENYIAANQTGLQNGSGQPELDNNKSAIELSATGTNLVNNNAEISAANLSATDKQLDNSNKRYVAAVKQKQKPAVNALWPTHAVVLSILTAPDVNGVGNSFSNSQVGSTTGLMLSVGLTHRLTISTGAMYAKKPYSANFSQYTTAYPFKVQPTNVYADCRVLDIPINIDYRLYSKGRNMIALGTGISSYFMLRENYRFDYENNPGWASTNIDIKNQNQHILGVLNINATYQRRINEKFGLNVQPYMKLPLTSIGYGKVDLQSTGVAVGVSWYLTSSRPK
jgi:hypothetical protein